MAGRREGEGRSRARTRNARGRRRAAGDPTLAAERRPIIARLSSIDAGGLGSQIEVEAEQPSWNLFFSAGWGLTPNGERESNPTLSSTTPYAMMTTEG